MMKPKTFFHELTHFTLAVIDEDGKPWAVPVSAQLIEGRAVEWFSKTNTVHSRAIARSPEVMLSAFSTKGDPSGEFGLFMRAEAKKVMTLPGVGRYRAEVYEAWYTDERHKKTNIAIEELA